MRQASTVVRQQSPFIGPYLPFTIKRFSKEKQSQASHSCCIKEVNAPCPTLNISLGALKRIQCDPGKAPYVLEKLIQSRPMFCSKHSWAETGLKRICGLMHRHDCLELRLNIKEDELELGISRGEIQILRLNKIARPREIIEAISSPLFPWMDSPGMALMEARDRIYEYDDAKEEKEHQAALQASLKRWEMLEDCFNKVPKKFWPICQFKVPKGITTEAGEETCQGLMLCPSDADYEPNGNHETDDEILLSRTDSIKCSIMEAGYSNSELVLRSAHKDIEKLAATAAEACDGFSQGFAQLMSISKLYLYL